MKRIPTQKQHEGARALRKSHANEAWAWACDVIMYQNYCLKETRQDKTTCFCTVELTRLNIIYKFKMHAVAGHPK